MRKRSLHVRLGCLGVALLLLIIAGCGKKETTKQARERGANVRVQKAETKALRPFIEAVGTLKASENATVSSKLDELINAIRVDEGSVVQKGDLLAEMNERDYELEIKRSEAALKQAEAALENAKLEYQRKSTLFKEELVTQQQLDDVSTRMSLAAAEVDKARSVLSLAKEKLSKTKIYSPMQGVIKEKKVSVGDFVKSATALFTILNIDPLKLDFTVTEKDAGKVRIGQEVSFQLDASPGKDYRGRVTVIYPHLEEATRTLMVQALVMNHDHFLKPGSFTRVTLYLGPARPTVLVPINAILYDEAAARVFVVEDGRAVGREVKLGAKYGDMQEIIEGVKDKETVVTVGQNNLAEGVKVNVAR